MGRTLLVGDVHGCSWELGQWLERVKYASNDRVVFAGDLIGRGPDSVGVLEIFRRVGARGVLGNHEERLLAVRAARLERTEGPRLGPRHWHLFGQLEERDWDLLGSLPRHLELSEHCICVVHAGIVPGMAITEQLPWTLTHMRSLARGRIPSDRLGERSWAEEYAGDLHVVFGHNSKRGLQIHPFATGLDTGCVYGGKLSGMVLESGEGVPLDPNVRRSRIVSVQARTAYYP